MSYQELPVQMHPRYQEFLAFMVDCPHRKTPECMQTAFWAWLKNRAAICQDVRDLAVFSSEQTETIKILKADLDRLHRERDSFQEQARCLAETSDNDPILRDYSVWQAISDLERVCRHRTATAAEDWLQVEAENRTHIPTIEYALEALKAAGVQLDEKIGFPNIRIIYDRGNNKFFGKS